MWRVTAGREWVPFYIQRLILQSIAVKKDPLALGFVFSVLEMCYIRQWLWVCVKIANDCSYYIQREILFKDGSYHKELWQPWPGRKLICGWWVKEAHLWPRVSSHQARQLQGLTLPDSVHPLCVALLLNVTCMTRVHDPDSRGGCGANTKVKCHWWDFLKIIPIYPILFSCLLQSCNCKGS